MPPPTHSVANPFFASRLPISCSSVTSTRAPDAPIGWPMAIAPPFTFTRLVIEPKVLDDRTALRGKRLVALDQIEIAHGPARARCSARRVLGIGPVPISAGSTPAVAKLAMRASGVSPRRCASAPLITTNAAAPSLMPLALPAVTVPSF